MERSPIAICRDLSRLSSVHVMHVEHDPVVVCILLCDERRRWLGWRRGVWEDPCRVRVRERRWTYGQRVLGPSRVFSRVGTPAWWWRGSGGLQRFGCAALAPRGVGGALLLLRCSWIWGNAKPG